MTLTEESAEELRQVSQEVRQLVLGLASATRLRPNVEALLLGRDFSSAIEAMLNAYLDALTASTPLLAQEFGKAAQNSIDQLSSALARSNERAAVMSTLERGNYLDEGGLNLLDAVSKLAPGKTMLELDQEGGHELSLLTGRASHTPGMGITHLVLKVVADHHLDPEAYRSKLRLAGRLLRERRSVIGDLLSDPQFQSDMSTARSRALLMNITLDRLMRGELPDFMLVDQLMNTYRECLEVFGLPSIAFVLRITGRKTARYKTLRSKDVSELADYCKDHADAAFLIGGFSKEIRHAASHAGAYEYADGTIEITLRTHQEVLEVSVLVDRMLEFLESCQALMLLVENETPPSVSGSGDTSIFMEGMTSSQRASFILRSCGAPAVQQVDVSGGSLTASITWDGPGLILLCRSIARCCPPGVNRVRVVADGGARYVEVPLVDLEASLLSGVERPSDTLRLLKNAKGPAGLLLTTELLRQMATNTVAKAEPTLAGANDVKEFWRVARDNGDIQLERALRAALVRIRLGDDAIRGTEEGRNFMFFGKYTRNPSIPIP